MLGFGRRKGSRGRGFLNLPQETGFSRLPGEGEMGIFNAASADMSTRGGGKFGPSFSGGRSISTLGPTGGPMTTSRANYGHVLEARRQAKLASTDPGLSTRGRMNAPGRGARPVTGGLEGRGVRPAAGTRTASRPIPRRGLENRGVRPAAGSRLRPEVGPVLGPGRAELAGAEKRANVLANINASRAARGGATGQGAALARSGPVYGPELPPMLGPGRKELVGAQARANVMANISRSKAARGGGTGSQAAQARFGPMLGPGRAELNAITSTSGPMLGPGRAELNAVRAAEAANRRGSAVKKAGNMTKALDYMKANKLKTGLLAGAGAIGMGLLLGNRRERGSSSGAQGRYGY